MESNFRLPVVYNDKEYNFSSRLIQNGFTIKIEVLIEGVKVNFEPDEERNWRALLADPYIQTFYKLDPGLIKAAAEALESLTK